MPNFDIVMVFQKNSMEVLSFDSSLFKEHLFGLFFIIKVVIFLHNLTVYILYNLYNFYSEILNFLKKVNKCSILRNYNQFKVVQNFCFFKACVYDFLPCVRHMSTGPKQHLINEGYKETFTGNLVTFIKEFKFVKSTFNKKY